MYNEVRGYNSDEVYRKVLEKAYRCLRKALITSLVFLFIGAVVSTSVSGFLYRNYGSELNSILSMLLSLIITAVLTLLIALFGVSISKNYMDRAELDFLNGVFKDHSVCSDCNDCKIISNFNGVFFSTSDGTLVKISEASLKGIKVVSEEYYEITYACVIKRVKYYSVYDDSGKLLGYKGEVQ